MRIFWGIMVFIILIIISYSFFMEKNNNEEQLTVDFCIAQEKPFTAYYSEDAEIIALKQMTIVAPFAGILFYYIKDIGELILTGDSIVLLKKQESEIKKIKQELEFAIIDLDIINEQFENAKDLLNAQAISEREYKELRIKKYRQEKLIKNIKESLNGVLFRAEFNGQLVKKNYRDGDVIVENSEICVYVDPSSYAAKIFISQDMLPNVTLGQEVHYSSKLFEDIRKGRIIAIDRIIDNNIPKFKVIAGIEKREGDNFFVGVRLTAKIIVAEKIKALAIPIESVLYENGAPFIFLSKKNIAYKSPVSLGLSNDEQIEILKGIAGGDTVITYGNIAIKEGSEIRLK